MLEITDAGLVKAVHEGIGGLIGLTWIWAISRAIPALASLAIHFFPQKPFVIGLSRGMSAIPGVQFGDPPPH